MEFPFWYKRAEELYVQNVPYYKIAEELGVGRKSVSHWLRKGGHLSNQKYVRRNITNQIYNYDESIFEKIDTEEKAYWLGFLYADGYISDAKNDIEVGLAEKDKGHLDKLRDFFKTDKPIKEKSKKVGEKIYRGHRLMITSPKIKTDLIRLGCVQRKSLTLMFPTKDQVPDDLMQHFVRGYFDGDGCITHTSNKSKGIAVEILGTKPFLESLIAWTELDVKMHGFNHAKETFRVQFFGAKAESFLHSIYNNSSISLERKYQKYNQFALSHSDVRDGSREIGGA